nr:DUF5765 transmembrane domain-containing protein [Oceanusvirus sp.]
MCFTREMSLAFTVAGLVASVAAVLPGARPFWWILVVFYTGMEALQYFQHYTVNKCSDATNRFLTRVAYLYIIVQPFLWHFYLWLIYPDLRLVFSRAMIASGLLIILFLARFNPFVPETPSVPPESSDEAFRGPLCTKKNADGHLYWLFPMRRFWGLEPNMLILLSIWWVPMMWTGWFRPASHMFLYGVAWLLSGANKHETASIWCLYSIPAFVIEPIFPMMWSA